MNAPMDPATIIDRLQAHIAQMAPHQKNRDAGKLLIESASVLMEWQYQRSMLAKLAAETPLFYNPLVVYEAKKIRDAILNKSS